VATVSSNQVTLSWSTYAIGFVLQQNAHLGTTNWVGCRNAVNVVSNLNQVSLKWPTGTRFFRLCHPLP
jgi:hypothetical protein